MASCPAAHGSRAPRTAPGGGPRRLCPPRPGGQGAVPHAGDRPARAGALRLSARGLSPAGFVLHYSRARPSPRGRGGLPYDPPLVALRARRTSRPRPRRGLAPPRRAPPSLPQAHGTADSPPRPGHTPLRRHSDERPVAFFGASTELGAGRVPTPVGACSPVPLAGPPLWSPPRVGLRR